MLPKQADFDKVMPLCTTVEADEKAGAHENTAMAACFTNQ